jgi:hypothetical protein
MQPDSSDSPSSEPLDVHVHTSYGAIGIISAPPSGSHTCPSYETPQPHLRRTTSAEPEPASADIELDQLGAFLTTCSIATRPGQEQADYWLEAPLDSDLSFDQKAVQHALREKANEIWRSGDESEAGFTEVDRYNVNAHFKHCVSNQLPSTDPTTFGLVGLTGRARRLAAIRALNTLRLQTSRLQRAIEKSTLESGSRERVIDQGERSWLIPNRYSFAGEIETKEALEKRIAEYNKNATDQSKMLAHRLLLWDQLMSMPAEEPKEADDVEKAEREATELLDWLESDASCSRKLRYQVSSL